MVTLILVAPAVFKTLANLSLEPYMKKQMADCTKGTSVVQRVVMILSEAATLKDEILVPLVKLVANVAVDVNSHEDLVQRKSVQQAADGKGQNEEWKAFLESVVRLLSNTQTPQLMLQLTRLLRNLAATETTRAKIVEFGAPGPLFQVGDMWQLRAWATQITQLISGHPDCRLDSDLFPVEPGA